MAAFVVVGLLLFVSGLHLGFWESGRGPDYAEQWFEKAMEYQRLFVDSERRRIDAERELFDLRNRVLARELEDLRELMGADE